MKPVSCFCFCIIFRCFIWYAFTSNEYGLHVSLLPDTKNCRLRMRRECRERFPRHWLQRKPLVSDPVMHHGTCVTHVPWCMSGSLIREGEENVPGIPGACASRNFTYLVRGPWQRFRILHVFYSLFSLCNNLASWQQWLLAYRNYDTCRKLQPGIWYGEIKRYVIDMVWSMNLFTLWTTDLDKNKYLQKVNNKYLNHGCQLHRAETNSDPGLKFSRSFTNTYHEH